ncbi:MAG: translocation/assembly module TamB [Holophagales bacterium]|nr:translocation/assembly module TamB [Holophagales bacterium]
MSFIIAGGAAAGAGAVWLAHSAPMQRLYINVIASKVKNMTGLNFDAKGFSFSVFSGEAALEAPYLGDGLFSAEKIVVEADVRSLFGGIPHIKRISIIHPMSRISPEMLKKIQIKDSDGSTTGWVIDKFEAVNGRVEFDYPSWGVAEASYDITGSGSGPNALRIGGTCPNIIFRGKSGILHSSADFQLGIDENELSVQAFNIAGELLKVQTTGAYDIKNKTIQCKIDGSLYSQHLSAAFGDAFRGVSGEAGFQASLSGQTNDPKWNFKASGDDLSTEFKGIERCGFNMEANGDSNSAEITFFNADLDGNSLSLKGTLSNSGSNLSLNGKSLPLRPLSALLRSSAFDALAANVSGELSSPEPLWAFSPSSKFAFGLKGEIIKDGSRAGGLNARATESWVQIDSFKIAIPEAKASASGRVSYSLFSTKDGGTSARLTSLRINAEASTSAEQVALSLDKWGVVNRLPISGRTDAHADITWSRSKKLNLSGHIAVSDPVYFGASADSLTAEVSIESDQLFLDDISLRRGDATASGKLWLTWGKVPHGADQINMRYKSFGLPLSEGLDAGISDMKMLEAMAPQGTVDGWVEISGPYESLFLRAEAELHDGSIYGVALPAFSGGIEMDLSKQNNKLLVKDFRLADSMETIGSLDGQLAVQGHFNIDLGERTWAGKIFGKFDSLALGMRDAPQMTAWLDYTFDGPMSTNYGLVWLPEGQLALSKGEIIVDSDTKVEGIVGKLSLDGDSIDGELTLIDYLGAGGPLLRITAEKDGDATQAAAELAITEHSSQTADIAKMLTNGAIEDIVLGAAITARAKDGSVDWKADISEFEGRALGLDISSLGRCAISGRSVQGDAGWLGLNMNIGSRRAGSGSGELTTKLEINGSVPLGGIRPADLHLSGQVDLEQAKEAIARLFGERPDDFLAGFRPRGKGEMDFWLRGPYDEMGLDGRLTIRSGLLEPSGGFPYAIEDLDVDLACEGRRVDVRNVRGRVLRGMLRASGQADWDNNGIKGYSLKTNLDDFHYDFIPEGFRVGGSLDARFQSTRGGGEIRGNLNASYIEYRAEIDLMSMILNNSIKSIHSIRSIDFKNPLDSITLNLDVDLQQPWTINTNLIKVKGNNKPSEKMKIMGTLANPGILGGMELVPGGRITNILPAGDVIIEGGSIDFMDPRAFDPEINIQGQIDVTPYRVNLVFQGPIDSLNMALSSTPTLRQDEIFSLLLNPAAAQTIGRGNAYASSLSTTGLEGTTSGLLTNLALTSTLEQVRKTLRFDRVSVALRTGIGGIGVIAETDVIVGKNLEIMDWPLSLVGNYRKIGETVTLGGQMEMRFGNFVIHLGASGNQSLGVSPSGEIRYSWSAW